MEVQYTRVDLVHFKAFIKQKRKTSHGLGLNFFFSIQRSKYFKCSIIKIITKCRTKIQNNSKLFCLLQTLTTFCVVKITFIQKKNK